MKTPTRTIFNYRWLVLFAGLLGLAIAGCSGEGPLAGTPFEALTGKKVRKSGGDDNGGDILADLEGENTNSRQFRTLDNSGANFQVKNIALLRSSITSCMGDGMLSVSSEMVLPLPTDPAPPELEDGKIRFLIPGRYSDGEDIIEAESKNLVDAIRGNRTGIVADSLTDTYLRSLETIANVVAHHCELSNENCQCNGKQEAREFLERCMPGLDPETKEMDEAAEMMGIVCEDGAAGMREAIASILSSYAFASAR